jgi:hypothetical protein
MIALFWRLSSSGSSPSWNVHPEKLPFLVNVICPYPIDVTAAISEDTTRSVYLLSGWIAWDTLLLCFRISRYACIHRIGREQRPYPSRMALLSATQEWASFVGESFYRSRISDTGSPRRSPTFVPEGMQSRFSIAIGHILVIAATHSK